MFVLVKEDVCHPWRMLALSEKLVLLGRWLPCLAIVDESWLFIRLEPLTFETVLARNLQFFEFKGHQEINNNILLTSWHFLRLGTYVDPPYRYLPSSGCKSGHAFETNFIG